MGKTPRFGGFGPAGSRRKDFAGLRQVHNSGIELRTGGQRSPEKPHQGRRSQREHRRHQGWKDQQARELQVSSHITAPVRATSTSACRATSIRPWAAFQQQQGESCNQRGPEERGEIAGLRVESRPQNGIHGIGHHFHAGHERAVLIAVSIGLVDERRGQTVAFTRGGRSNQHVFTTEAFGGSQSMDDICHAVCHGLERARRADVVDGHAASHYPLGRMRTGLGDEDGRRRHVQRNRAPAENQGVACESDTLLPLMIGNPDDLNWNGAQRKACIVGSLRRNAARHAFRFHLHVHMSHSGGSIQQFRQGHEPSGRAAVHGRIDQLRAQYDVAGSPNGSRQHVVVLLVGGIGKSTSTAMTLAPDLLRASMALASTRRGHGNRPNAAMLFSSMATIGDLQAERAEDRAAA